jgi:hypothetical protein
MINSWNEKAAREKRKRPLDLTLAFVYTSSCWESTWHPNEKAARKAGSLPSGDGKPVREAHQMTTLFDSARLVNPAHTFGESILPTCTARFVPSDEDLRWAAYELNKDCKDFDVAGPTDAEIDFAASCAMAQARLDAGFPLF